MTDNCDTIAAIATPVGNSGIGIIRISGQESIRIADEIIRSRSDKCLDLFSVGSHTIHYGYVYDNEEIIDEVLCMIYRSPRSYTAEDTVEISCHGGIFVLNRVLSIILSHGARLAEPGEFTKRAFLNERIDLSQAESVMGIISSENEFSRSNSLSQLTGSVKKKVYEIREKIIHETAYIEAALDDPENYDLDEDHNKGLRIVIKEIICSLDRIILNAENVRFLNNGINTVIIGKPNVGKSSLFNLLSGYDRAIVTDIPGTTRDIISEKTDCSGIILNITDTAGIHRSEDKVENIGIRLAEDEIDKADLILLVIDSSEKMEKEDFDIIDKVREKKCIVLLNKSDRNTMINKKDIISIDDFPVIYTSVKDNTGIDELKSKVKELFVKNEIRDSELYITNKRQLELFKKAKESLSMVLDSADKGISEDLYTIDMMDAYTYLGEIIGEDISDDLADRIFSEFCMGK